MSVSAATPVLRGYLSDLDCRWSVISDSVDDRTEEERGVKVHVGTNCVCVCVCVCEREKEREYVRMCV